MHCPWCLLFAAPGSHPHGIHHQRNHLNGSFQIESLPMDQTSAGSRCSGNNESSPTAARATKPRIATIRLIGVSAKESSTCGVNKIVQSIGVFSPVHFGFTSEWQLGLS